MIKQHRKSGRHARTVSLGILAAAALGGATQGAEPTPAHPAVHEGKPAQPLPVDTFVLVAYLNAVGGASLARGDYAAAMERLRPPSGGAAPDVSALDTNRCVAAVAIQQLRAARTACDQAVEDAQHESATLPVWGDRRRYNAYAAQAYSNRAVLEGLTADSAAAAQDLTRAQNLAPEAAFVIHNLAVLRARLGMTAAVRSAGA